MAEKEDKEGSISGAVVDGQCEGEEGAVGAWSALTAQHRGA